MKNNNRILKKPCQHLDLLEKALSKKAEKKKKEFMQRLN